MAPADVTMGSIPVGFRGGFIFPTFFAGTAFGHAIWRTMNAIPGIESWFGSMPPVLFCMTVAVGGGISFADPLLCKYYLLQDSAARCLPLQSIYPC